MFLGAMTFADGFAHGAGTQESRRIVDGYAAAGGNVVDTAINYRDGASEEIVGEVLAGRRDQFVLATKYGASRDGADPNAAGNHRKNLRRAGDEPALRRLRTDYIDLYYVQIWDHLTPVEETMRALDDAVQAEAGCSMSGSRTPPAWVAARARSGPVAGLESRRRAAGPVQPAQPRHRT
jgi:aryl-alcohol dehydrogenase-like predicted oxidoreductase